jgi:hypothetical protein
VTATLVAILVLSLVLLSMGRESWCDCGNIKIWYGLARGPELSQQLFDWYSFTHVVHGILLYAIVALIGRKMPKDLRFLVALCAETSWEILENTSLIIERYRLGAVSFHYYGDSVINSIGDLLAAVFGYLAAGALPVWCSVAIVLGLEGMLAYAIRDNLTLNLLMLIRPIEAVKKWQSAIP